MIIYIGNMYIYVENLILLMKNNYFSLQQCFNIYNLIQSQKKNNRFGLPDNWFNDYQFNSYLTNYNQIKKYYTKNKKSISKPKKQIDKNNIPQTKKIIFKHKLRRLSSNINFKFPDLTVLNTKQLQKILEGI